MTNEEIITQVRYKYPTSYSNEGVKVFNARLEKMSPVVRRAIELFLNGRCVQFNVLGHSVETLMRDHGMNEIAAYLTLDWIIKEPDAAMISLKRGHDVAHL